MMAKLNGRILSIEDDELLRKYNDIWNEVSNSTKKQFDREPFYNDKLVKIKIKYLAVMRLQIFTMKNLFSSIIN